MKVDTVEHRHIKFLFLFLLFFLSLFTKASDFPPVSYLGIEQGLSNNAVTCIYQDYKGFMWFGTFDGLNRYDGYEFKIFRNRIGDSTSLLDNTIYTIEGDKNHNIWIGGRKGLSLYNLVSQSFSSIHYTGVHQTSEQKLSGIVHSIKPNNRGDVFVGTEAQGLILFTNGANKGRQMALLHNGRTKTNYEVTSIEVYEKNQYAWVFVENEGLGVFDPGQNAVKIINTHFKKVNLLKADRKGHLWVGTDNGLYRYDIAANTFSENYTFNQTRIVNISIDKAGTLWLASDGNGVLTLPNGADKALPFITPESKNRLSSNAIFSIYEDGEGRKWIGTLRGGINVIEARQNPFTTVYSLSDKAIDPARNFINTFCENPDRNIWIGTSGGGLKYWNRQQDTYTYYTHDPQNKHSISSNIITYILNDFRGDTWIATWNGGINRYNKQAHSFERFSCYNPFTLAEENKVWVLYEDAQKTLWASTTNNGTLYTLNRATNKFELFNKNLVNIQLLAEDRKGTLWAGDYAALIRVDKANKKHVAYKIGYTIRSLHEDKWGNFWVGTDGGGLLNFNRQTGKYKRYTINDGLPNNTILRMLEDSKGALWLSTFNGLTRLDPQTKVFRNFTQSDGLQSNQFNFNAALALQSGELMLGGIKGFTVFYPDSVYDNPFMPKAYLTDLTINNTPLEQNDSYIAKKTRDDIKELKIPYDEAVVSLNFAALEYSAPDKIKYAYYLKGWDKGWNDAGKLRTANYTHLREGSYLFKIKNTNAAGRWGPEETLVKIVVLPPWYRSGWAYVAYLLAMGAAIYLYILYTKKQERLKYEVKLAHLEKEKEKQMNEKKFSFFTHIAHEFRTPITLIVNPIKDILQKNNQDADTGQSELNIVYRNARRLLSLVDQLLLFRKAESETDTLKLAKLNFYTLCQEVYLCFVQQAKARQINYAFECAHENLELFVDREKMEIALYNLISNALKYTPKGGSIKFTVTELNDQVAVAIADTGYGIPESVGNQLFDKFYQVREKGIPAKAGFGIGLYLVKHFIECHKGEVTYESQVGKGTTFKLVLHKGKDHLQPQTVFEDGGATSDFLEDLVDDKTGIETHRQPAESKKELNAIVTENQSMLIVDDNKQIRTYIAQIFQHTFLIYEAENGEEGIKLAQQHLPDIIISDVVMQGISGVDLCKTIKEDPSLGHIPVILLTGSSSSETKLKGVEGGADDYITKPFEKDMLVARVANLLKSRNSLQQYFYNEITLKKNHQKISSEYKEFLEKCIAIVEAHLENENFSIKTLATEIGMSHSNLYKRVKSISGQSANGFIRFIRLRKAAELFISSTLNVNETAYHVGLRDIKYFREQFYKLFGMNPSDYIKKYRKVFSDKYTINKNV